MQPINRKEHCAGSLQAVGQDQDNFIVVPLRIYLKFRGQRNSLTLHVKAEAGSRFSRGHRTRRAA